jgi:hypothetical protein
MIYGSWRGKKGEEKLAAYWKPCHAEKHQTKGGGMGEKRIILSRLQNRFIRIVKDYMRINGLNQTEMAKMVGMPRHVLNYLLHNSIHREFSVHYLRPFINMGIISVNEIYDGDPETMKEKAFWDDVKKKKRIIDFSLKETELMKSVMKDKKYIRLALKNKDAIGEFLEIIKKQKDL